MARASRSNKKQPAFDPSELEDLIFSPAVGKGVGSHLVRTHDMATVVTSNSSTAIDLTTVDRPHTPTVDINKFDEAEAVSSLATVVRSDPPTIARSGGATSPPPAQVTPQASKPAASHKLWITENGDLVPDARVRKIRLAQDVINSAEENVYDTLWNAKLIQTDEREACRIVQAGYDYLVKRTRLARKTIQRIVAKLLEKDFIAIETRADIYQRSATVYRVFSYKAVLERHVKKGRLYVAKMGPGFSYAKPLESLPPQTGTQEDLSTVVTLHMAPMVRSDMSTIAKETTVTVVKTDRPTVVNMSGYLLDTYALGIASSSALRQELSIYGPVDDDAVHQLVARCSEQAPDCTEDEILHFIRDKSALIQKKKGTVYNPLGFLLTAVPRCFAPETLRAHREEMERKRKGKALSEVRELAAMERWRREQEASLSDPNVSEQEKHLIRLCLGLNTN
jgi:predicted transcriptional regulator